METTILLLDDDEDEYYLIKMAAKYTGIPCRCSWAADLEKATKMVNDESPDFIFIDINMPRHNGLFCLEFLKQQQQLKESVFIIYSNYISTADRRKVIQMGAYCLLKPENINVLRNSLQKLFSVRAI